MNNNDSKLNLVDFAELTKLAIGARSVEQFSKETNLSINFLTKAINNELTFRPSFNAAIKIAEASQSRVSLIKLLKAIGYVDNNCSEEELKKQSERRAEELIQLLQSKSKD